MDRISIAQVSLWALVDCNIILTCKLYLYLYYTYTSYTTYTHIQILEFVWLRICVMADNFTVVALCAVVHMEAYNLLHSMVTLLFKCSYGWVFELKLDLCKTLL